MKRACCLQRLVSVSLLVILSFSLFSLSTYHMPLIQVRASERLQSEAEASLRLQMQTMEDEHSAQVAGIKQQ